MKWIKEISQFIQQFNSNLRLDESDIIRNRNRYYLLSKKIKQEFPKFPKGFFYAGAYLGTVKGANFFPSFLLLGMIAKKEASKVIVDRKTAWLFICGRDVFRKGLLETNNLKKGDFTLVMNEHNECLGFGKINLNLRGPPDSEQIAIKNILDIGDFLRREKPHSKRIFSSNRKNNKINFQKKKIKKI